MTTIKGNNKQNKNIFHFIKERGIFWKNAV